MEVRQRKTRKIQKHISAMVTLCLCASFLLFSYVSFCMTEREQNDRFWELYDQGYSAEEAAQIVAQENGYTIEGQNRSSNKSSLSGENADISAPSQNLTHAHTWITTVTKEATCTEQGEQTSTCSGCGETKVKATPKAEHTYTVASMPGTCLEAAKDIYTCAVCGHSYTEKGKKGEHDYQLTNAESGTCQTPAKKTYTCSVCGNSYVEEGELGEHDYQLISESEHDACTESGEAIYSCSVCGDTYTETVEPLGHELETTKTVLQEATCTEDGKRAYLCSRCGTEVDPEVIPATGHNPQYEVVKEAGLFTQGDAQTLCTVCGEVLSAEVLPAVIPLWAVIAGVVGVCAVGGIIIVLVIKKQK